MKFSAVIRHVRNIGWLAAVPVLSVPVNLCITAIVARHLGPSALGVLATYTAIVAILTPLATLAGRQLLVQLALDVGGGQPRSQVLASFTLVSIVVSVGLFVATIFIVAISASWEEFLVSLPIVALLLLSPKVSLEAWFIAAKRADVIGRASLVGLLFLCFSRCLLVYLDASLIWFAYALLAQGVLTVSFLIRFVFRIGLSFKEWSWNRQAVQQFGAVSIALCFAGFANVSHQFLDQLMLRHMLDTRDVGIYSAAARISEFSWFIPGVLAASFFPAIVSAKNGNARTYEERMVAYLRLHAFLAYTIAFLGTVFATKIVSTVYGADFQESSRVLVCHVWSCVFVFSLNAKWQFLYAEKRYFEVLAITLLSAALNFVINLFAIPIWGGIGAAFVTLVTSAVGALATSFVFPSSRPLGVKQLNALATPWAFLTLFRADAT